MNLHLAKALVDTLPRNAEDRPGLFHPWLDRCPDDLPGNTPQAKINRLAAHLDCEPRVILCGEAPGYQGCRHSGVAFTSERLLLEGCIPRMPLERDRLTARKRPFSEPSATIVWGALHALGIAQQVVLWNALQLHPYRPEERNSNRTPSEAEIRLGAPALQLLVENFPRARVVAVGKKAEGLLAGLGIPVLAAIRHPANGGAKLFYQGLSDLINSRSI